ncbi:MULTISPECIES: LemA family protein [unclassified Paraburkholderia]|uniref:LemA family protein n=1 Tax=unclassified Paraburkholderia TaxID=2615204 RepID=UPI00197DFE8C|nr:MULTISPECIES: LemA family protein [unclassified Paraburkholderia]MBN3858369.1 LemA family protein [Paraburkholderia sp. Ac-20340]
MKWLRIVLACLIFAPLTGCGYNAIQSSDEDVNAAWSEVLNQYQRRADLVPNLAAAVKGYAAHEASVLTQVTEARARVGSVQMTPEMAKDPNALAAFDARQGELTSALSRLMVVSESYPQLKADGVFRDLQVQLEGTENRIAVARGRYIRTVQQYNVQIRQFPGVLVAKAFGYQPRPNFSVTDEAAISKAPTLDFTPQKAGTAAQ